eukprot:1159747-Pelagomonas_calceolata.AAC.7
MEEDILILDIIISLTKVTVLGRAVFPSCCLIAKVVNAEFKPSHAANDIMGEVKKHIFGENIGRIHNQGSFRRRSAPLMIGQAFTVVLSRVCVGKRLPMLYMPGLEIYRFTDLPMDRWPQRWTNRPGA